MAIVKASRTINLPSEGSLTELRFYVVFTTPAATKVALGVANGLAHNLGARLILLVAQVVPFPLPLDRPPVHEAITSEVLSRLVSDKQVDTSVQVYLCRDRNETVRQELAAESIVLVGTRGRWLRRAEWALAKQLRNDGHHVILVANDETHALEAGMERVQPSR